MQNHSSYLFTLELRIRKQIVKLNVYEEDSLNDLILRLSSTVHYKEKHAERLKEKLEGEFRKLLATQECSRKVKSKLESLTEESKLIIIGVSETDKNEQSLNETPFKILMETSANGKRPSADHAKRQYNYEDNGSPLIRKYNKQTVAECEVREEVPLKYNYSNEKYSSKQPVVIEERPNFREYSPIANINSMRSRKSSSNHNDRNQLQIIAEEEERNRKEGCIRKFTAYPQKVSVGDFNYKESFQDYKMQKNKSQSILGRPSAFEPIKRNYVSSQDDVLLTRVPTRLTYNQNQEALTKIDYSSKENTRIDYSKEGKLEYLAKQPTTKIDYSAKYIEGKPAVGGRGNKKFSYLSQAKL